MAEMDEATRAVADEARRDWVRNCPAQNLTIPHAFLVGVEHGQSRVLELERAILRIHTELKAVRETDDWQPASGPLIVAVEDAAKLVL